MMMLKRKLCAVLHDAEEHDSWLEILGINE
jgi:hypothetical protein